MISRKDICSKLRINSKTLEQYLAFMAYPQPSAESFESNLAQAGYKLHDLIEQGFSFNEITDLIHCAEKYCDLIPDLKEYLQLSESINLRETIESYHEVFEEFSSRENQYQDRIQDLEADLLILKSKLDKTGLLEDRVSNYQDELSQVKKHNNHQKLYISNMEIRISELENENSDLQHQLHECIEELNEFKGDLGTRGIKSRSAIDFSALLKRKEKEISLKYQKEISDLKKQVEFILENKKTKKEPQPSRLV